MVHIPLYVRYVKALGAIFLPANALHLSSNTSDAPVLVHNFSRFLVHENASRNATRGLLLAGGRTPALGAAPGGRGPGCCPRGRAHAPAAEPGNAGSEGFGSNTSVPGHWLIAKFAPEATFRSFVVFAVMIVLATAVLIASMFLMVRGPSRDIPQRPPCPPQTRYRPSISQSVGTDSDQESVSERAGLASSSWMTPRGPDDCGSEAAPTEIDTVSQSPLELAPLCPQLKVPDTSKLRVVLPQRACRKRQDAIVDVCSVPQLGGKPLLRARLTECEPTAREACGIYLEALGGDRQHAFLATGDLWAQSAGALPPKLFILRPDGRQFATMEKTPGGDYTIMCKLGVLATFSGDFLAHETRVFSNQGWLMAQTEQGSESNYEVTAFPGVDAGLVLLGLLAIDKCETYPSRLACD
jgi:hypothetical protein